MDLCTIGDALKLCPNCGATWCSIDDLLSDPGVVLIGYQPHFEQLQVGLLYFNHSCGGTFTISAHAFEHLYAGPVFANSKTGSEECPGHCQQQSNLEPCPAECECAYIREIIQIIKSWPQAVAQETSNTDPSGTDRM